MRFRARDTVPSSVRLSTGNDTTHTTLLENWRIRRLMPTECEALMGFPRGYTAIPYRGKPAADGPRYKALGNSFAVNVVRWIGQRIALVDEIGGAA
ncbi:MAG TPA: DNA cytosine methyltransferase [Hyphomicrobium sp.]|nr:DNA cytosine methyltransferase [Hyphomicrobium sp.]